MKIEVGKVLKPKQSSFEDSFAEITSFNNRTGKYNVVIDDNFSAWLTREQIEKDFEEFVE